MLVHQIPLHRTGRKGGPARAGRPAGGGRGRGRGAQSSRPQAAAPVADLRVTIQNKVLMKS
jgi:hypothetical protein